MALLADHKRLTPRGAPTRLPPASISWPHARARHAPWRGMFSSLSHNSAAPSFQRLRPFTAACNPYAFLLPCGGPYMPDLRCRRCAVFPLCTSYHTHTKPEQQTCFRTTRRAAAYNWNRHFPAHTPSPYTPCTFWAPVVRPRYTLQRHSALRGSRSSFTQLPTACCTPTDTNLALLYYPSGTRDKCCWTF